jgi:protein-tyrosine phosphatase
LVSEAGLREAFEIDSAGTAGYHSGEPPDRRARAAGQRAGIPIAGQARQFVADDFARFDYVIAMDATNASDLRRIAPDAISRHKVRLMRAFDPDAPSNAPVPDPYYGEDAGFDEVLELCRVAGRHLLEEIRKEHRL